jgi:hypothetical protein
MSGAREGKAVPLSNNTPAVKHNGIKKRNVTE